jgi:hypothetical protein
MMPYIFIILIIIIHLDYTTKEESTDKSLVIFMYLCQFIYFSPLDIYDVKNIYPLITTKNDNNMTHFSIHDLNYHNSICIPVHFWAQSRRGSGIRSQGIGPIKFYLFHAPFSDKFQMYF